MANTNPIDVALPARLRAQCESLRRKPTPLADLIPLLQQAADEHDKLVASLRSARMVLDRCGPHLHGVEQECCGQYEAGYGGEYMGQREVVPVCCDHPIDLSDHVANELHVIDAVVPPAPQES